MTLQNVTDTYQQEVPPHAPANEPVYDLAPPVDLTDPEVFSSHGGYTHEAFAMMRDSRSLRPYMDKLDAESLERSKRRRCRSASLFPILQY